MAVLTRKERWRLLTAGVGTLVVILLLKSFSFQSHGISFGQGNFLSFSDKIAIGSLISHTAEIHRATEKNCSMESNLVNRKQDDPVVLECVRENLVIWPDFTKPYNLSLDYIGSKWDKMAGQWEVIQKLLKNKKNGIFVEAGANNGEFISTTLRLEQEFNWTGILVEPDPAAFAELKTKQRKAWLSNVCLSPNERVQQLTFTQHKKISTWSKLASAVGVGGADWKSSDVIQIAVPCIPFYSLVSSVGLTEIDYFSLDVEGAEMQVLRSIPFDEVLIRTLTVEYDKLNKEQVEEMHKFMAQKGFKHYSDFKSGIAADFVYVHNSVVPES